jgi:hypothetical protein
VVGGGGACPAGDGDVPRARTWKVLSLGRCSNPTPHTWEGLPFTAEQGDASSISLVNLALTPLPDGALALTPLPDGALALTPLPDGALALTPLPDGALGVAGFCLWPCDTCLLVRHRVCCVQSLKHNSNGRFVTVCGDGEYVIYTALAWRNKSFGR